MKLCPLCQRRFPDSERFCDRDAVRLTTYSRLAEGIEEPDDLDGLILDGRYRVEHVLGEGGTAKVYRGHHLALDKPVAIKILKLEYSGSEIGQRFKQEAVTASHVGSAHIAQVIDYGETPGGQSYLVMEYLEGRTLGDLLVEVQRLPAERAVQILLQCCEALSMAHGRGIIHRDLKPENIFVCKREGIDHVKLLDFGIAKVLDPQSLAGVQNYFTKKGQLFGTPEYMAPEQGLGKPVDARTDLYALGVVMFEMLLGRIPYSLNAQDSGDPFLVVLAKHQHEPVPSLKEILPVGLQGILVRALAKRPEHRYQTAEDFARALERAMAGEVPEVPEHTLPGVAVPELSEASQAPTRKRWGLAVVLGVSAVLALVAGAAVWRMGEPQHHPIDSQRHPIDSQRHPIDSQRHPIDSQRHPIDSQRHPREDGDPEPVNAAVQVKPEALVQPKEDPPVQLPKVEPTSMVKVKKNVEKKPKPKTVGGIGVPDWSR